MAVEDIDIQPISCVDCDVHFCEFCGKREAVVAVATTDPDDPRIFMICGNHTLLYIAKELS